MDIGEGKLPIDENNQISLTDDFGKIIFNIPELINSIYPDLTNVTLCNNSWWCERAILCPKNSQVTLINSMILNCINTKETLYVSIDTTPDPEQCVNYPSEFLHTLNPPGFPPHELKLKVGILYFVSTLT